MKYLKDYWKYRKDVIVNQFKVCVGLLLFSFPTVLGDTFPEYNILLWGLSSIGILYIYHIVTKLTIKSR